MASSTVTLEKGYFETLLRRAQFHAPGADFSTPIDVATVTIPKSDHDSLLISARQYANLRRNLYLGGIADETLAVLIKDDTSGPVENGAQGTTIYSEDISDISPPFIQQPSGTLSSGNGQDYTFGRNANYTARNGEQRPRNGNGFQARTLSNDDYSYMPDPDASFDGAGGNNEFPSKSQRHHYDKFCKRTILLANLPEGTIHSDIVDLIRGGLVLDIFLRTHDRAASISFLEESAAQEFFRHVKRHDLYIRGKRVEIRWHERQFILPGHVANKIAIGATRNLVIQGRQARHTEEAIRDDLEHIHNLVVIKITFSGQNAHISTNSVHNAMFARTCMMSRAVYKGSKIEWDVDECAAPLQKPFQVRNTNLPSKKKEAPLVNRFHLLNIDGTDDDSQDDEETDTSGVTLPSVLKKPTGIVA